MAIVPTVELYHSGNHGQSPDPNGRLHGTKLIAIRSYPGHSHRHNQTMPTLSMMQKHPTRMQTPFIRTTPISRFSDTAKRINSRLTIASMNNSITNKIQNPPRRLHASQSILTIQIARTYLPHTNPLNGHHQNPQTLHAMDIINRS